MVSGEFCKLRYHFVFFGAQLSANFLNSKLKHVEPLRAQNLWKVKHFEQHLEPFHAHTTLESEARRAPACPWKLQHFEPLHAPQDPWKLRTTFAALEPLHAMEMTAFQALAYLAFTKSLESTSFWALAYTKFLNEILASSGSFSHIVWFAERASCARKPAPQAENADCEEPWPFP